MAVWAFLITISGYSLVDAFAGRVEDGISMLEGFVLLGLIVGAVVGLGHALISSYLTAQRQRFQHQVERSQTIFR
jgi:hypothetical protein